MLILITQKHFCVNFKKEFIMFKTLLIALFSLCIIGCSNATKPNNNDYTGNWYYTGTDYTVYLKLTQDSLFMNQIFNKTDKIYHNTYIKGNFKKLVTYIDSNYNYSACTTNADISFKVNDDVLNMRYVSGNLDTTQYFNRIK